MTAPGPATRSHITTVDEYDGRSQLAVSATQLGTRYSAYRAKKIVEEWCDFFAAGPSPITDLTFTTRTPKRLFASLRGQTQLEALSVKWGDYDDLSPLTVMRKLSRLRLGGASSIKTLQPLAELPQLRELEVESLRHVHDLSPLAALTQLRSLELGGNWMSPRDAHVDSIDFLRQLPPLERLVLHTIIVNDQDYSPLLTHAAARELRVMATRGMRPSHDELCSAIPAMERLPR